MHVGYEDLVRGAYPDLVVTIERQVALGEMGRNEAIGEELVFTGVNVDRTKKTEDSMDPGYGVGWGTLALINAGLAQSKDRSGLAWFFASLFLGPLATLLIVVLD